MTTPENRLDAEGNYDVAIVGGGPAGLSAAIWLARYERSVVVVDSGDPRNWETRGINGFLGLPKVKPPDLRASGRDECRRYGVQLIDQEVCTVKRTGASGLALDLADGRALSARRLLLAIGVKDVWPDVPGLDACYGESAHVCPDCDGYEVKGKKTVVIGTGRRAVGMALALANWTDEIIICTNCGAQDLSEEMLEQLQALNIPVLCERVQSVTSMESDVSSIQLEGGMQLDCEQIFFSLGQHPADDLGAQLRCERDDAGLIVVDNGQRTSVENVYAAGDITPGPQLAVSAAAAGAVAAIAIHKSLLPEELRMPD
ncbi:MAG: NAD(P)/FAD-dependent oxidoreductase [Gemmatimonadaceae bacterium]